MHTHSHTHTFTSTGFSTANTVDSARANLSSSFVNGFVNAGFCTDKLLVTDGNKWIYKNKGVGMMSAAASLGLILLWDVEGGLSEIDKFLYASEDHIKVNLGWYCVMYMCRESSMVYTSTYQLPKYFISFS